MMAPVALLVVPAASSIPRGRSAIPGVPGPRGPGGRRALGRSSAREQDDAARMAKRGQGGGKGRWNRGKDDKGTAHRFTPGRSLYRRFPLSAACVLDPLPQPGRLACDDDGMAGYRSTRGRSKIPSRVRSRSEEHTSELQSRENLVCRLLLEKKKI